MPAAFITGAATGIGREVALALAAAGYDLTLADVDMKETAVTASGAVQASRQSGKGQAVRCEQVQLDVRDEAAQAAAVHAHVQRFGRMDVAVLNAGIGERGQVFEESGAGWQATLDIDLTAVISGARAAAMAMERSGGGGTIITVASAGGIFPMPVSPVYAAAKAGVVHFVRSGGAPLDRRTGIKLMAVCPEFVDTPLIRNLIATNPAAAKQLLGSLDINLLPPKVVADLVMQLVVQTGPHKHRGGTIALLRQDGSVQYPFGKKSAQAQQQALTSVSPTTRTTLANWVKQLPAKYNKLQVHTLSHDFHAATRMVEVALTQPGPGQLLLKRVYVGINASDINYTAGRYFGSPKSAAKRLPFDCGFESVSVVAAVGQGVTGWSVGDCAASMSYDGFAEFAVTAADRALPVPAPSPQVVALLTSGLTASIALEQLGHLKPGQTVLVTAAAGGTGQFAVQLARMAGCTVIATAGGPDKAALCRSLGAHRVVDYHKEDLRAVLKSEFPKGVDIVYESVGGDMFNAAVDCLAERGVLIIIGMMSQYQEGWPQAQHTGLPEKLLWKSATMAGFFLLRYAPLFRQHLQRLLALVAAGKLQVAVDPHPWSGLSQVPRAVDHLQSGKSKGKVVVQLSSPPINTDLALSMQQQATSKL